MRKLVSEVPGEFVVGGAGVRVQIGMVAVHTRLERVGQIKLFFVNHCTGSFS